MMPDRIAKGISQCASAGTLLCSTVIRTFGEDLGDAAEARPLHGLTLFYPKIASRGNSPNTSIHRVWVGNVSPEEKTNMTRRIRSCIDSSSCKQRLDLRSNSERMPIVGVVDGLNSVGIARHE